MRQTRSYPGTPHPLALPGDQPATLPAARFAECPAGFTHARNVLTGEGLSSISTLQLPAETAVVLELLK